MVEDLERVFFSEEEIAEKVKEAGIWLDERYKDAKDMPLAIGVLKGSVIFMCDIIRAMKTPVELDFMTVSSYGNGTESTGRLKIKNDLTTDVKGRDVLLIEDIVDTGYTLESLTELIMGRGAKSFTTVTLFDKPSRRKVNVKADYSCFEVGDEFIVGYGLDYAQKYRNLPCVGVLKREIYEHKPE